MSHVNTDLTCMDWRTSYRIIALSLYDEKERKSQKHLETALVDWLEERPAWVNQKSIKDVSSANISHYAGNCSGVHFVLIITNSWMIARCDIWNSFFFLAFDFWSFVFFIPATTANDPRLRRIFYSRFYPLHLFSYLNTWERARIFPFECWVEP